MKFPPHHDPEGKWTRRRAIQALGCGAAALLGPWSGCRRKPDTDPLELWHIWPRQRGQPIVVLLDEFRRLHPGLPLQATEIATNNLKPKLLAACEARALPDVFLINSGWIAGLGAGEHMVDLLPLARGDGIEPARLLHPVDYRRCLTGSSAYCLPATSASGGAMLFTNGELLEAAGVQPGARYPDWEAFTEASRDLVARANSGDDLEILALEPFMGPGMVIHTALAAGIEAPTTSADGLTARLLTPGSLRVAYALDDYVQRVYGRFGGYRAIVRWRFRFAGQHRRPAFASLPYGRQIFALAAAGSLANYRREQKRLNVTVQPVPGLERLHGGIASHTWAYAVNAHSRRPREAWTLARFLTLSEEGVGRFCREYGRPSPLLDTPDAAYYATVGPVWDQVKEAASLDLPHASAAEDEYLRFHFYTVPMRRMQGETMEQILGDIQARYQAYLDRSAPGVI